jgi:predicted MFS family arabinose efflux permease
MWSASFDAGTAVGALAPGLLVAGIGLPPTYGVVAVVLLVVVPVAQVAVRRTALS